MTLAAASSSLKDKRCKQISKINVANKEVLVITKNKTMAEGKNIQQDSHATHKGAILHATYTKKAASTFPRCSNSLLEIDDSSLKMQKRVHVTLQVVVGVITEVEAHQLHSDHLQG